MGISKSANYHESALTDTIRSKLRKVIDEQKVTISDLQKENETLKATIAREKVASIELGGNNANNE